MHICTHVRALYVTIHMRKQISTKSVTAVADMLSRNTSLTYMDVSWNHLRPSDLK